MKNINVKRAILENGALREVVKVGFSWGTFYRTYDKRRWPESD